MWTLHLEIEKKNKTTLIILVEHNNITIIINWSFQWSLITLYVYIFSILSISYWTFSLLSFLSWCSKLMHQLLKSFILLLFFNNVFHFLIHYSLVGVVQSASGEHAEVSELMQEGKWKDKKHQCPCYPLGSSQSNSSSLLLVQDSSALKTLRFSLQPYVPKTGELFVWWQNVQVL